jgi:hypothetical protein
MKKQVRHYNKLFFWKEKLEQKKGNFLRKFTNFLVGLGTTPAQNSANLQTNKKNGSSYIDILIVYLIDIR